MKKIKLFTLLFLVTFVAPYLVKGQYALNFDGVDDYVDCGTNPELNITGDITIELWIYLTGPLTIFDRLVEKDWATSYFFGGKYGLNGLAFSMDANNNSANVVETATNILNQNVWTHVAASWDGATMKIYINGEEVASKPWVNTVDGSTNSTKLGKFYGPDNNFYKGYMDEVRIWSEARTAEQLQNDMYKTLDNPLGETNLVAYYTFSEGSGQTTADNSQNSNTGVLGGTSNPETSDPLWVASTAPIPFYTINNGNWSSITTWANGQGFPSKDWSRVSITHDVVAAMDISTFDATISSGGSLNVAADYSCSFVDLFVGSGSDFTLEEATSMDVDDGGTVFFDAGASFNSFGIPGDEVNITHNIGYFDFEIATGADIAAIYTNFEFMNANGIKINGNINPAFPLRNCSFANGEAGGTLLSIGSNQNITLEGLDFPDNSWSGSYNISKTVDDGQVDIWAATGNFAGETYENDAFNRINWSGSRLMAKVYLEGAWNGTDMNAGPVDVIPLGQPFSGLPWNYAGSESVTATPPSVVDWALIEFRDATDAASATTATTVYQRAVFINTDGNIVSLDGYSPVYFDQAFTNNFYLVVVQRNHLDIMSNNALTLAGSSYDYDFSSGAAQVYGGTNGHKEISTGIYGMISGDSNGNGTVNINDKTLYWENEAGTSGYLPSDLNLDGNSSNLDKNDFWLINVGKFSQVPN